MSEIYSDNAMLEQTLHMMMHDANKYKTIYSMITVSVPGSNHRFDLKNNVYSTFEFDTHIQRELTIRTRDEVLKHENNNAQSNNRVFFFWCL